MTEHVRRYEVGGLIAQGGMAEVVAARAVSEAGVAKRVALKRIRTDRCADPAFVARFFDEARLAMQLSHANIVQVFDFGRTEEGEFFLAMEFVEGVDLHRLRQCAGHQRLPPSEALHIVAQTLRGLDYAHRRTDDAGQSLGIVHLDVKPANVLISFEGEVKLADFGVARSRDARPAAPGIAGTISFMSPEQARGERVDVRSDVFSSGVLLYALLTGACPFGEADDAHTLERVRVGTLALPGSSLLDPLLSGALDPSPQRRFPTAGAFADAVEELLYAQAWRGGGPALADRIRAAFPAERDRLTSLFAPAAIGGGLAVARPSDESGGSVLSRITEPLALARQTQVANLPAPRARGRYAWGAAIGALAVGLALGAGYLTFWRRPPEPGAPALAAERVVPPLRALPHGAAASNLPWAPGTPDVPGPLPPPEPPAAPSPGAEPAVSGAETPGAEGTVPALPPPPRSRALAMGTLTVNANPWGTVSINGHSAGPTPLLRHPLRAGPATISIENPKLGRREFQVRVQPNRDLSLIVDFRSADEPR